MVAQASSLCIGGVLIFHAVTREYHRPQAGRLRYRLNYRVRDGIGCDPVRILLIMRPHANDFYDSLFLQYLIDQSVLNIDAAGIGAGKVAHQFFKPGRSVERVFPDYL